MPLYSYKCRVCGEVQDAFRKYEERERCEDCCEEQSARRILTAPRIRTDELEPFQSPATGEWITSKSQQREDLRRSGCRLAEPDESKYVESKKKDAQKDFERENGRIFDEAARDLGINVG
jgi:putative FmdB family regulatory protein